jgi:DNA-directed RNA polymerase, mitochondrial
MTDEYEIMRKLGDARITSASKRASAKGSLHETRVGNRLLQEATKKVAERLREMYKTQPERSEVSRLYEPFICSKNKKRLYKFVMVGLRLVIGDYPSARKQTPLAVKIGRALEEELQIEHFKSGNRTEFDYLKRYTDKWSLNTEAHRKSYFKRKGKQLEVITDVFSHPEKSVLGMFFLEACVQAGVVDQDKRWERGKTFHFIVPRKDVLDWIMKADEALKLRTPFWLPIKSTPEPYEGVYLGGYKAEMIKPRPCVKIKSDIHRDTLMAKDMPAFYSALDKVSNTAFLINPVVRDCLIALWGNGGRLAGLPDISDPEIPPHPGENSDRLTYLRWKESVSVAKARYAQNMVDRKKIVDIMMVCRMMGEDAFYFPHHADARGRLYPLASTISFQGNNLQRAITMFADCREIKSSGEYWLRVNVANHYGLDKLPLEERVKWTHQQEALFVAIADDPLGNKDLWVKADSGQKPWTFLAAAHELGSFIKAKKQGKPFFSHLPCYVDCSSSGFQHLSLLALDSEAARRVNVAPTESPQDIYKETAMTLLARLEGSDDPLAVYWIEFFKEHPSAIRKIAKRLVMCTPYGITRHSGNGYVLSELEDYLDKRNLLPAGGINGSFYFKRTAFLTKHLMAVIRETNISAFDIMDCLREVAQIMANNHKPFGWTTPSGFYAFQHTPAVDRSIIKFAINGKFKFWKLGDFNNKISKRACRDAVVPNFIHSMDAAALHLTINKVWDHGVKGIAVIHDAVAGLAEDLDIIIDDMRTAMSEMYQEDRLEKFVLEVLGQLSFPVTLQIPGRGDFDPRLVCESKYFLS